MSFTRLDCAVLKNERVNSDSSFCALFNPQKRPGSLSFVGSIAARESIGGQVASKLALEHFIEGIIDFYRNVQGSRPARGLERESSIVTVENIEAIEAAFKRANSSVYNFGHKLAAGGRMAASLIGASLQENVISIGKVGQACAYLCRGTELYPFFEINSEEGLAENGSVGSFVGVASLVSVQLSSVQIEEGDLLFFSSDALSEGYLNRFFRIMDEREGGNLISCDEILRKLYPRGIEIEFAVLIQVGPDAIFLDEECI